MTDATEALARALEREWGSGQWEPWKIIERLAALGYEVRPIGDHPYAGMSEIIRHEQVIERLDRPGNRANLEQAAEAVDREATGAARDSERTRPSAAVAPPTSSAEVGGSLDVEALREAVLYADISLIAWQEVDAELVNIAAAYADAIRKRDPA